MQMLYNVHLTSEKVDNTAMMADQTVSTFHNPTDLGLPHSVHTIAIMKLNPCNLSIAINKSQSQSDRVNRP